MNNYKRLLKKEEEELQMFLHFRKRASKVDNKKGKGSFRRNRKHKDNYQQY